MRYEKCYFLITGVYMNNKTIGTLKVLLVTLITATAITGIGFLDNNIWNIIIAGIGVLAYAIVGILCSANLISNRETGKTAYAIVFMILLIIGFFLGLCMLKSLL